MATKDKLIFLGVISAAHGIKGEVLIKTFNSNPEKLTELELVDCDHNPVKLNFVRIYPKGGRKGGQKGGIIAKPEGCNTRSQAEQLAKTKLYCQRDALPSADQDEFYVSDLEGMRVVDMDKNPVGSIVAVHNFGAGDILEIEFTDSSKKSEMFPFTKEIFPEITDDHVVFNH